MAQETARLTFNTGAGIIEPSSELPVHEVTAAIELSQKPIEDAVVVCIDGRPSVIAEPIRAKMAGGNYATALAATVLSNWTAFTPKAVDTGIIEQAEEVLDVLLKINVPLGGHKDNHHHLTDGKSADGTTGCGAADKFDLILGDVAERGLDDEFIQMSQKILQSAFNVHDYKKVVTTAKSLIQSKKIQGWRGDIIAGAVLKHGSLETLSANIPDNPSAEEIARHNHWEQAIKINSDSGTSSDRDNTPIQYFQVDVPAVVSLIEKLPAMASERSVLLHAAVLYQLGTAYRLTKNQNVVM
ncbi:MAG: hypothetical protein NVS1B7_6610 [Candidatus Saccharimonadales bacterium]